VTFAQPQWFAALTLLPLLAALFMANEARRKKLLRRLVAARLQDRLAGTVSIGKRRLRFALVLLGAVFVIASLAQPQLGYTWEQSQRKGRDVIFAIDVSKSMLGTDLAPSRLVRAKLAAQDLIAQLGGDRVGLVAFAGTAFLQAPLTVDYSAVLNSLKELDSEIIPRGGSNLAETIKVAVEAFGKGESENRALIIFSDGEELDSDGIAAAARLAGQVRIFTVGVGTTDGSLLPVPGAAGGTEFVKDENGQFVKSRLDESRLRKIAESTGGFYVHLLSGPAEMTQIVREGLGKMTEKDIDAKMSRQPIERYQWPLAAGLVLLASSMLISERRRTTRAAAALFAACALTSVPAQAAQSSPRELYSSGRYEDAQKAYEELVEKDAESEALAFNWGAAAYKNKDYDTALQAFSQALTSDDAKLRAKAEYNLANTLLQKGAPKLEEKPLRDALAHYEQTLKLQPNDADALHNKKFTEELLAKLEQKKDKKDDQKKDQQDQEKQQQGDKKDDQQQQSGDQSKQDKQQGDKSDEQKQDGQQSKNQQEEDGEKQPQDGSKQEEKKDGEKRDAQSQQKDGEKRDAQDQEAKNDARQGKDAPKPEPMPEKPGDKKPAGELKASPSEPQQPQDAEAEAAAEEAAAAEGKMTERQAKALLDSLKSEDDRVRLIDPNERKRAGRVLRDW
jgi:Ca-activated chloride channel family protein